MIMMTITAKIIINSKDNSNNYEKLKIWIAIMVMIKCTKIGKYDNMVNVSGQSSCSFR